jgi:c-di-GMP-binding flagellar brake protein YcgR
MKEQRRYVRIDKTFAVSFHKVKGLLHSGTRTKDISEGGVCLPLDQYFCVDSLLEIEIRCDDFKGPLKALVRIVWIVNRYNSEFPFEAGLEFLEIPPVQRDILRDYINRYVAEGGQQEIRWID